MAHASPVLLQPVPPEQHASPSAPQGTQLLLAQPRLAAVHRPPQHAWLAAPQPPQLLPLHTPKPGQVLPVAMQIWFTQQPPPEQLVEVQHASPGPPHSAQMPFLQTALESQAASLPVQHAWPFIPHGGFDEQAASTSNADNARVVFMRAGMSLPTAEAASVAGASRDYRTVSFTRWSESSSRR